MEERLSYARATVADVDDWLELAERLWPQEGTPELRAALLGVLAADDEEGVIVRRGDGRMVAFMNLSLRRDYVPGATTAPVAYVEGLYVEPDLRGRRLGRSLIGWAERWGRGRGCGQLASDVLLDNEASQAFHEAVGFDEVERTVCYIKPLAEE